MAAVSRPDVAQAAARRARALNPLAVRDVSRLPADLVIPNPGERRQKEER